MAAWQIPLEGPRPQPNPGPLQSIVMGQDAAIQGQQAMQMQQMRDQQIQQLQMENQQKNIAMQYQQMLNSSIQKNIQTQPDGTFQINHGGVVQDLASGGFGSQIPGYQMDTLKIQQAQAANLGTNLKNKADLLEQLGQYADGPYQLQKSGAPDDQIQADYGRVLNPIRNTLSLLGQDPKSAPDNYDANVIAQFVSQAPKTIDVLRQSQLGAEMAGRMAAGLPKSAAEWQAMANKDISTAQNQDDINRILTMYRGFATAQASQHLPDTGLSSVLQSMPTTFSADAVHQAKWGSMTPEAQQTYTQKSLGYFSQLLGSPASTSKDAYTAAYTAASQNPDFANPEVRAAIPTPDEYDAAKTPAQINAVGQSAEQKAQLQATQNYRNFQMMNQATRLAILQQNADFRDRGNTAPTPAEQRDQNLQDKLQGSEQGWWDAKQHLFDIQDSKTTPNNTQVSIPRFRADSQGNVIASYGPPQAMTDQLRKQVTASMNQAVTAATNLQSQQTNIRRRHQWGEFAPGGQAPPAGAPNGPTPGAPTGAAPAPPAQTGQPSTAAPAQSADTVPPQIRGALKGQAPNDYKAPDGSIWHLDADGSISPVVR